MNKIPYPSEVDYSVFAPEMHDPPARYGLPAHVAFCKRCVVSNQRPNSMVEHAHTADSKKQTIHFDEEGICDACRFAERKASSINWTDRERQLCELCDRHRSKDGSYDCLVPGSGGKDSFYAAHMLKYKYNMHPLTVTWAPHIYTPWGWKNFQNWLNSGFDNILYTPNPRIHRLLTRLAVDNLFHPFQPFILGQKFLAPKLAMRHGISLIFYGENEAEYGNPIADVEKSERDKRFFSASGEDKIFFGGVSIESLQNDFGIPRGELDIYLPASLQELRQKKIETHYLGYYLPWHPKQAYNYAAANGDFNVSPRRNPGTYTNYNSIDDKIDDFHYYTTYIKFGIGRATYDASQEIRNGEMTRGEGVDMVKRYDGEWPERFAEEIFNYLSITPGDYPEAHRMFEEPVMDRPYFDRLADTFRSPHLWMRKDGGWRLRTTVFS